MQACPEDLPHVHSLEPLNKHWRGQHSRLHFINARRGLSNLREVQDLHSTTRT